MKCLFLETQKCNTVCRPKADNDEFDNANCDECEYNNCKYCVNATEDYECIGEYYERKVNERKDKERKHNEL